MYKFIVQPDESTMHYNEIVGRISSNLIPFGYEKKTRLNRFGNYFIVPTQEIYNFSDLPVILHVQDISNILKESMQTCYNLCQTDNFPAFKPSKHAQYIIPKHLFMKWLENQAMGSSKNED